MLRSRAWRGCALAALLAVLATGCGDDDEDSAVDTSSTTASTTLTTGGSADLPTTSTTPTTEAVPLIEVAFARGQVTGGAQRHGVPLGQKVRLRVTADEADEVHVHTYDLRAEVGPGQPAEVELTATIPGQHEVELEDKGRTLLVLVVQ